MNITSKKENLLLDRTEVQGTIEFEGATPSKVQVTADIATQMHLDPATVSVQHIYTLFGHHQATFTAMAYTSVQARKKMEVLLPHLKKKEDDKKTEKTKIVQKKGGA